MKVHAAYIEGIKEGRRTLRTYLKDAAKHIDLLEGQARRFPAATDLGQFVRGERDFWRNQLTN